MSIDNACFGTADLAMLISQGSGNLDSSNHKLDRPIMSRRLSLNNNNPTATFLATNVGSSHHKNDLDLDCHSYDDENPQTSHSRRSVLDRSTKSSKLGRGFVVSDEEESDFDSDGDSFCDAGGAEQANEEWMRMGASCIITDDFIVATQESFNGDLDFETYYKETGIDVLSIDEEEIARNEPSESSSDCDSFCDANEKELANPVYLKTDLGASIMINWSSKEDLLLEAAEIAACETISEDEEVHSSNHSSKPMS